MNQHTKNTALLVFIRSEEEEAQLKQLGLRNSRRQNLKLVQLLNKRIKRLGRNSGLPTYIVSGKDQEGQHFGERLSNSMQKVFAKGYDQVIAVGNDCLSLNTQMLREASSSITEQGLILGPDNRGGAYLIGMHKRHFDSIQFAQLEWQSESLIDSLLAYAKLRNIDTSFLDQQADINTAQELSDFLSKPKPYLFFKLLHNLSTSLISIPYYFTRFTSTLMCIGNIPLRAPPALN